MMRLTPTATDGRCMHMNYSQRFTFHHGFFNAPSRAACDLVSPLPAWQISPLMPAIPVMRSDRGFWFMSSVRKVLVCDDDNDLRTALVEQLGLYDEFQVKDVNTATAAVQLTKADHFDLVVMDVGLPDIDGREAVKIMRKNGFKSPILMLTGHDGEADTILGLEAGANDYVTKPFRFAVLLARIRAHLRQHESSDDAIFQVGPYTFKPGQKLLVTDKGSKIRLTEKETAIIRFLYRAGQRVIARDVLLQEVWGYNSNVTTHTLETHIYRLRQKIEPDPGRARLLVTESGGYKLIP
jgi:DNA-binding response OmpR family regulator